MNKSFNNLWEFLVARGACVSVLAVALGEELKLPIDRIDGLMVGACLHDIGLLAQSPRIVLKREPLTDDEIAQLQTHPVVGYDMVKDVPFPWPIAQTIIQHHERLDGSGYPMRVRGSEIILEARIIAVADVVDAMSAYVPYRDASGRGGDLDRALTEIRENRGRLYDENVVDACLTLFLNKGFAFSDVHDHRIRTLEVLHKALTPNYRRTNALTLPLQ